MPLVLYLLGLAVFAQATSEFMLSGLVPDIARDLAVPLPAAGALTSAFAVGMIVGAPAAALLARRLSPRRSLLVLLGAFLAAHLLGALTPDYPVLLGTRVVAALANAGFLAVALRVAAGMVEPGRTGRATAVLLGGTTLACVAGVPAGALLGQLCGWRSAFWAVALICLPALCAIALRVPHGRSGAAPTAVRAELRALRRPRTLLTLACGALVNGATFCSFTYLAPVTTEVAGLGGGWVPGVLALFGAGAVAGVGLAGRFADAAPWRFAVGAALPLPAGWLALAVAAGSPLALPVLAAVVGTLSFATGSTLIAQVLREGAGAPTLAGAAATVAFNVGAAVGPWAGGVAIGAGPDYRGPLWVSAALVLAALAVAGAVRATSSPAPGSPAGR